MKFYFRGLLIFEFKGNEVITPLNRELGIPNFNYCVFGKDDYLEIARFFQTVHKHLNGEKVQLQDIELD